MISDFLEALLNEWPTVVVETVTVANTAAHVVVEVRHGGVVVAASAGTEVGERTKDDSLS